MPINYDIEYPKLQDKCSNIARERNKLQAENEQYEYWLTEILGIIRNLYSGIETIKKIDKEFSRMKSNRILEGIE